MRVPSELYRFDEADNPSDNNTEDDLDDGLIYFDSFAALFYSFDWLGAVRTLVAIHATARNGVNPETMYLLEEDDRENKNTVVEQRSQCNTASIRSGKKPLLWLQSNVEQAESQLDYPVYQQPTDKNSLHKETEFPNQYEYVPCEYKP